MHRRSVLARIGGTVALAAGVPSVAGRGPPSGGGPPADVVVPDDYATIQGGVDAADPGDTVLVDGGTYREQVLVNKDLTLEGQNTPTIEALEDLTTYNLVESGSTWAPMVFAYGGDIADSEVSGSATVAVDITGFELDGRGNTGQAGRKTAIVYRNVGGDDQSQVANNDVLDMGTPGDSIGIVAYGDSDVRVEDNELTSVGRGGIGANGDGGDHPSPNMVVRNNRIDADTEPGGSAPNGVQIGFGATGNVQDNTIENCRYAEDTKGLFQSSGILIFESDGVKVRGNTLENNDVAAAVSAWGWFLGSATDCKVVKNDISDALFGVNLRATAWDQDGGRPSSPTRTRRSTTTRSSTTTSTTPRTGRSGRSASRSRATTGATTTSTSPRSKTTN